MDIDWMSIAEILSLLIGGWIIAAQTPGRRLFKAERTSFTWQIALATILGGLGTIGVVETLAEVLHWNTGEGLVAVLAINLAVYILFRLIVIWRRKPDPPDSVQSV